MTFDELYKRYYRETRAYLYRLSYDVAVAEEVQQEVWLKISKKMYQLRKSKNFRAWIYTICRYTYYNRHRIIKRDPKKCLAFEEMMSFVPPVNLEKALLDKELLAKVYEYINKFPPRQREAFKKRIFEDKSFKEIASDMDCCYDTAKANFRHGLLRMKEFGIGE